MHIPIHRYDHNLMWTSRVPSAFRNSKQMSVAAPLAEYQPCHHFMERRGPTLQTQIVPSIPVGFTHRHRTLITAIRLVLCVHTGIRARSRPSDVGIGKKRCTFGNLIFLVKDAGPIEMREYVLGAFDSNKYNKDLTWMPTNDESHHKRLAGFSWVVKIR